MGAQNNSGSIIDGSKLTWESGVILPLTGVIDSTYPTYISSGFVPVQEKILTYIGPYNDENNVPYQVFIAQYSANKSYMCRSQIQYAGDNTPLALFHSCAYVRIMFGHPTDSGVTMDISEKAKLQIEKTARTSDTVYAIENKSVTNGDVIKTNVPMYGNDVPTTIVLDGTFGGMSGSAGVTNSLCKFLRVVSSSTFTFQIGRYSRSHAYLSLWWQGTSNSDYVALTGTTTSSGRKRFVVTHDANSGTLTVYSKMGTNAINTQTSVKVFANGISLLTIGYGTPPSEQGVPNGTIAKAEIYDRIWTQAEIDAFFA